MNFRDGPRAIKHARTAVALKPNEAQYWMTLGRAYKQYEQQDLAIDAMNQSLNLDPRQDGAHLSKADILKWTGELQKAYDVFSEGIAIKDTSDQRRERGELLGKMGRISEALDDYAAAERMNRYDLYIYEERGNLLYSLGRLDEAFSDFTRAIELQPERPYPYRTRARIHIHRKEYEKALQDIRRSVELHPNDSWILYFAALLTLHTGDREEYLSLCDRILVTFGNSGKVDEIFIRVWTCVLAPILWTITFPP